MNDTPILPRWIRLPLTGQRCPYTGLSRQALWLLTRPHERNHFNPPVRSKLMPVRLENSQRPILLIDHASALAYIESLPERSRKEPVRAPDAALKRKRARRKEDTT
jgi:hypothetical protein